MSDSEQAAAARQRAIAKYGFYRHLALYLVINAFLVLINIATGAETNWAIWPMLGWGIAVVIHGLSVFVFTGRNKIIDRMTEREMQRDD